MSKTDTARQLLIVALQDLRDAESAWGERGAEFRAAAGNAVRAFLDRDLGRSAAQTERLKTLLDDLDGDPTGDPNIWLRAILDDAARDIASTAAGPLRDTALIGAFRKGKQSERVSYETAIALAERLDRPDDAAALRQCRAEEVAADAELAMLLMPTIDRAASSQ